MGISKRLLLNGVEFKNYLGVMDPKLSLELYSLKGSVIQTSRIGVFEDILKTVA